MVDKLVIKIQCSLYDELAKVIIVETHWEESVFRVQKPGPAAWDLEFKSEFSDNPGLRY